MVSLIGALKKCRMSDLQNEWGNSVNRLCVKSFHLLWDVDAPNETIVKRIV